MSELEQHATDEAAGNDREIWPYDLTDPQPVVEVDEREARTLRTVMSAYEDALANVLSIVGADADGAKFDGGGYDWEVVWELLADGYVPLARRSQPAPRTVSEEQYESARQVLAMNLLLPRAALDATLAALGITVEAPRG